LKEEATEAQESTNMRDTKTSLPIPTEKRKSDGRETSKLGDGERRKVLACLRKSERGGECLEAETGVPPQARKPRNERARAGAQQATDEE